MRSVVLTLAVLALVALVASPVLGARHAPSSLTRLQANPRHAQAMELDEKAGVYTLEAEAVEMEEQQTPVSLIATRFATRRANAAPKKRAPAPKKATPKKKAGPQPTNILKFPSQQKKTTTPAKGKTPSGPQVGSSYTGVLKDRSGAPLNLSPLMEPYARRLKGQFPNIVFTSGRRGVQDQCRAMAGNVVRNRRWIEQTYGATPIINGMQAWVNANPSARTQAAIAAGICGVAARFPLADQGRISRHISGDAFDVAPGNAAVQRAMQAIVNQRGASHAKFLTKEGGLTIWHLQVM